MPTSFEIGTSLSHYRLVAPLGAGGMGEVYKAHDLALERTIALKILPPELVRNEERVRRFVQEAKAASSLNHPNIITIHEIGQAEVSSDGSGADSKPVHYIAMELIDGATLRRKIHHDDTDLRTLLGYLAQAAEGLSKAHAAGIIHRDLKPENIMITRDGYTKVLDFGLAKLSVKKSADASEATAVRHDTRDGALLGTVAYMSPEQVQGKAVDHRSDIFSFGSIVYEAATRQRPFVADSDVEVMHKIIHEKPAAIDSIAPQVPAELRRLVRRCMAKDPDKRYQSMKDIALELSEIVDEFEELSASATSASRSVPSDVFSSPGSPRRLVRAAIAAVAVLALGAMAVSVFLWRESRRPVSGAVAFRSLNIARLTSSGNVLSVAISPDGKYVAHVTHTDDGRWNLSVRQVATNSDVTVVSGSPTRLTEVAFTPDGHYLYYTRAETESGAGYSSLFQIPALGGPPRKIAFDVDTAPAFSPDGKRIAFGRGYPPEGMNGLIVANADGTGERELLRAPRLGRGPVTPSWSPDGSKLIIAARSLEGGVHTKILEVDAATGKQRSIGSTRWRLVFDTQMLPDASGIVLAGFPGDGWNPQVWLQPYPDGEAVRITNEVNAYTSISMTSDGKTLSSIVESFDSDIFVTDPGDASGGTVLTGGTADHNPFDVAVAATGAVVYEFDRGRGLDVAIVDGPGAAPRMLTSDATSAAPDISDDGKTIVFQSRRVGGVPRIFAIDAEGGNVRDLAPGAGPVIARDGSFVVYVTPTSDLLRVPIAGGTPQKVATRTNGNFAVSPDSKSLAYQYWKRAEGGREMLYLTVVPLAGGTPTMDVPFAFGNVARLRWTPSGDGIAYIRNTGNGSNIYVQPVSGGEAKQVTRFRSGTIFSFDWRRDGKLVVSRGDQRSDVVLISNFR